MIQATGHHYKEEIIAPTTEEEGYTLHTCKDCGDSYKDSYTARLLANRSTLSAEEIVLRRKITAYAAATGGAGSYTYAVLYKKKSDTNWTVSQNYSTNTSVSVKPYLATDYEICVKVKDKDGTITKKFFAVKVSAT